MFLFLPFPPFPPLLPYSFCADAEELAIEDDMEVAAPDPDAFLSASSMNKFLPRGTPSSVLADEIVDAPLPPIQKFDFDTIDYEEVHRVASKIKLKVFEKKECPE